MLFSRAAKILHPFPVSYISSVLVCKESLRTNVLLVKGRECSSWCCGLVLILKRGHLQKFPSNLKLLNVVRLKLLYFYTDVLLEWLFCLPGWTFVQPYVGWSIISKLLKLHENLWWYSFLSMVHGEYPLLRQALLKFFC